MCLRLLPPRQHHRRRLPHRRRRMETPVGLWRPPPMTLIWIDDALHAVEKRSKDVQKTMLEEGQASTEKLFKQAMAPLAAKLIPTLDQLRTTLGGSTDAGGQPLPSLRDLLLTIQTTVTDAAKQVGDFAWDSGARFQALDPTKSGWRDEAGGPLSRP